LLGSTYILSLDVYIQTPIGSNAAFFKWDIDFGEASPI
jgi:hypothetical protein